MGDTTQEKMRFALIGCGAVANKHATAIKRLDEAEAVGGYDTNRQTLTAFGEKHAMPTFTDVEEMIETARPHVLNILTPSSYHAENILDLTRFNRHFVVEKPLALRLDHVDSVLEACNAKGLKIFVAHQNRFNPPIMRLKEAIEKGRFGKLVLGTVRVRWSRDQAYYDRKPWLGSWEHGGGVLANQASHHIDMLTWMMGEAESVMAKTTTRLVDIDAEDLGVVIIKFRNGALGIVEATTATRPKNLEGSISVLGEKGSVEIGGFFMNELKTWNFSEPDRMDDDVWTQSAKVPDEPAWNHTAFYKNVIHSLKHGKGGLIDGLEGRRTVELINAIYESAKIGEEVFLHTTQKQYTQPQPYSSSPTIS